MGIGEEDGERNVFSNGGKSMMPCFHLYQFTRENECSIPAYPVSEGARPASDAEKLPRIGKCQPYFTEKQVAKAGISLNADR